MSTKRTVKTTIGKSEKSQCELSLGVWVDAPPLATQETLAQARLASRVAIREREKAQAQADLFSNALLIHDTSEDETIRAAALKLAGVSSVDELRAAEAAASSQLSGASASAESIALRTQINGDWHSLCARLWAFVIPNAAKIGLTPTRTLRLLVKSCRVNPEVLGGYENVQVDWVAYAREDTTERKQRGNWLLASIAKEKLPHREYSMVINRSNVNGARAKLCDPRFIGRKYKLHFVYEGSPVLVFLDRSMKQVANDWSCKRVDVWADNQWADYSHTTGKDKKRVYADMLDHGLSDVVEGMLHQSVSLPQLLEKLTGNTRPIVDDTAKPAVPEATSALGKEASA